MTTPIDSPARKTRRGSAPDATMALAEHLREARNRTLKSAAAVVAGMAGGFYLYEPFMLRLKAPIDSLNIESGREAVINFSGVGSSFNIMIQVSLVLGLIVSSPVWLYQLWAFVSPALRTHERRYAVGFLAAAIPLFLAGVAVAVMAMPAAVFALTAFTPVDATNIIAANDYITFVLQLVLTFGIAFVLPVFLVLLNMLGVLSGRAVLKSWRIVVVVVMVVSAMAAPGPDPMTMFYLAVPLLALFFVAVGLCLLLDKRRARKAAKCAAAAGATSGEATSSADLDRMGQLPQRL